MSAAKAQVRSLFFALQPDAALTQMLVRVAGRAKSSSLFSGVPRPAQTLHLTLLYLGSHPDVPVEFVRGGFAAAASVRFPPFEIVLDRIESLGLGKNVPCVLRCTARSAATLRELHDVLVDAWRAAGMRRDGSFEPETREFIPHVTLGYGRAMSESAPIDPIAWHVREFTLIESWVGQSTHRRVGVWPLA